MILFLLIPLFFFLLKAASEVALIVIAYSALQWVKYNTKPKVSIISKLKRAYKAF